MLVRSNQRALLDEKTVLVGNALRNLESALAGLDELLSTDHSWVSIDGESTSSGAMAKVRTALTEMDDDESRDRKSIPGCRGIVAVTPRVIVAAQRVNAAKVELKAACTTLRGPTSVKRPDHDGHLNWVRIYRQRLAVTALGRPNLNLFAAYRKIPILTGQPRRVRFSFTASYMIRSMPREVIASRLQRIDDPDSIEDLLRVQRLPQSETTLALLKTPLPFAHATVSFDGFDAQGRCHLFLVTAMPILYLAAGPAPTVYYARPRTRPPRRSPARAICPDQYLKTMRVHRYSRYMNAAETSSA
jgi:hypothetical protein